MKALEIISRIAHALLDLALAITLVWLMLHYMDIIQMVAGK